MPGGLESDAEVLIRNVTATLSFSSSWEDKSVVHQRMRLCRPVEGQSLSEGPLSVACLLLGGRLLVGFRLHSGCQPFVSLVALRAALVTLF